MTIQELQKEISVHQDKLAKQNATNELKMQYLGRSGIFNQLSKNISTIDDKKAAGQLLNKFKNFLNEKFTNLEENASSDEQIDLTVPPIAKAQGHVHPISQAIFEITSIFEKIGFTRLRYPEVDSDYYAFEALNMSPNHPARDEWETFFVDYPGKTTKTPTLVMTPHTSNGQVREMERLKKPPVRMINIARCYRRQQDATHTQMFHQFEGLAVDEKISIADLKGVLDYFAEAFYGPGTKSRIRPFHFQFTEPSFEIDFSCHICGATGYQTIDGVQTKCKFCKSGWHEVGGAGMVHPNVLKAGGFDPEKVSGFAFGWGIERTYTLKKGLGIDDIRGFYNGDLNFLAEF
ncbi:MAG: phenylalanine--tRNA ligase subunit alpha [Pseudomonadales bacterium]|nr:phenylalanine--tRNA ligase subunit alpha [Pseudomonadales bacterium]